ncbi:hypothetical protein [Flagellimonas sp.]|uniref:hypothetical protein n=1 Tax=Flagellimonas sp. TaxID=2058762 RepID=UPI003BA947BD
MSEQQEGNKGSGKIKKLIESGSEIGGSVVGTSIGLAIAGPVGALTGAALGPLVCSAFKLVGNEIAEKIMSSREQARVGATYTIALEKISNGIKAGKEIRGDDFFLKQKDDRSKSESILEGTLLKARNEYEEKKIKYYASFLANINFDKSVSFQQGNTLLRIVEQLSYRQLVIIAYLKEKEVLNTHNWMRAFSKQPELANYQDFYSELIDLYNHQLLQQVNEIAMSISSLKLSFLGNKLFDLLELDEIDDSDKKDIIETVFEINHLKLR